MKIHISEVRGIGGDGWNASLEFADITEKGLSNYKFTPEYSSDFHFYFTKSGKKTIRAFHTIIDSAMYKFICFYSRREEFFEVDEYLWHEIEVKPNGFI